MDAIIYGGLNNAAWTLVLALAVAAGARWWRTYPAVGHALWLVVLLKLVTPSLVQVSLPYGDVRARDGRALAVAREPHGPAPTARPPVDLGPAVSARVVTHDRFSPGAAHRGADTASSELARPLVPRRSATWEIASKKAMPGLAVSWLLGAIVWWSVVGLNSARFRRMIRSARPAPAELRERIGRVAERLGLRKIPMACFLPVRMSPMVWVPLAGPPHLVLPEELWGLLDATQQDAILAHELAHLKRRDHWVRRLETLACGLYWWDPVAWWACREVERVEERCCDAWVLWALPTAAAAYAEALVMTAAYLSGVRRPFPLGASGMGRLSPLTERLQMISSDPTTVSFKWTVPSALLVVGALSLPFLPAPTSGGAPVAPAPVAAVQVSPGKEPAEAVTSTAEVDQKTSTATTPGDQKGAPATPATSRHTVRVMQPLVREVTDHAEFVGNIVAAREAGLKARVSGTLIQVLCRPGQVVKRDDRLYVIDQRTYRAALDKAEAEYERALARQKQSQLKLANVKRQQENHVVSQTETDLVELELLEARASVKAAVAARDASRLDLEFTEVRAPFDGRLSGPMLGPGNVVVADTTLLATIVYTDQVFVAFNVDEMTVLQLRRKGESQVGLQVMVALPDEEGYPRSGKLDSFETPIDVATGVAHWRALIPNPDGLLIPGLFVRVRLVTSAPHKALLVPEQAVLTDAGQKSVFTLTDQGIVQKRPVKVGPLHDGLRSVEGLQADEWVVIDGVLRIREGAKVLQPKRVPPPAESSPPPRGKQ